MDLYRDIGPWFLRTQAKTGYRKWIIYVHSSLSTLSATLVCDGVVPVGSERVNYTFWFRFRKREGERVCVRERESERECVCRGGEV